MRVVERYIRTLACADEAFEQLEPLLRLAATREDLRPQAYAPLGVEEELRARRQLPPAWREMVARWGTHTVIISIVGCLSTCPHCQARFDGLTYTADDFEPTVPRLECMGCGEPMALIFPDRVSWSGDLDDDDVDHLRDCVTRAAEAVVL